MHIENLKIFLDLVDSKSFSRAAKLNHITQSAVSQKLRAMEKHFKVLILDRDQKQFKLTSEGALLYDSAQEIMHLYDKLGSDLLEMQKTVSGTIHLATIYSIGLHELPPYIKSLLQGYPSINVRVEYRRSNLVYEDVLQSAVDLGLVAYPVKTRQLEIIPFREDKLVVVCSPQHKLATRSTVTMKELAECKMVGFDPDIPTRKAIDELFRESSIQLEPVMEFDNIETLKRAVEIDAGVAIVPLATVQQEVQQRHLIQMDLEGVSVARPLGIIHRKGRILTPAMKKFIQLLTDRTASTNNGTPNRN